MPIQPAVLRVVLLASLAVAGLAACSSTPHFRGELPNSGMFVTDVNSAQAFRDHEIKVPAGIKNVQYDADSKLDGYPLEATFGIPCTASSPFVESNDLNEVRTYQELTDIGVVTFAEGLGWHIADPLARWYQRQGSNKKANLYVMITEREAECTVYLVSSQ